MGKPTIVAVDFETALLDGSPSVEYYRPDFRAISCAFSWRRDDGTIKSELCEGEEAIAKMLNRLAKDSIPCIAHNLQFEHGVLSNRFPNVQLNWSACTQRLTQVADNGGQVQEDEEISTGLSLQAAVSRWLPVELHNHKAPYHDLIRERGNVRKGKEGANLHLLTAEELHAYNVADTEVTLQLYETLTASFAKDRYDWTLDHSLYMPIAKQIADAKTRGVRVNREALITYRATVEAEIAAINDDFLQGLRPHIDVIEQQQLETICAKYKTVKGAERARERCLQTSEHAFTRSRTPQLRALFVDQLGMTAKFTTMNKAPSFAASFLSQWGEHGMKLLNKKKRMLVLGQIDALLGKSEYDGRWHLDLRACGTATGRFAGTGGLNAQGMARRDKGLMSTLLPDPGYTFVSCDLSAGEPTVTTHFSQDPMYKAATFDMVGKEPYWDGETLVIDDIYLMVASRSPIGKEAVKRLWPFNWAEDAEKIKKEPTINRPLHKILALGIGYSMGPKKMMQSAYEKGYPLDLATCREFFREYWELFAGVKRLSTQLERKLAREHYLVNPFGYRLLPDKPHKAFNYFIQSTVSGIINLLLIKFFHRCQEAKFITVIHDEALLAVPTDKLEEVKAHWYAAVDDLNKDLEWSVKIRSGWQAGDSFYTAK